MGDAHQHLPALPSTPPARRASAWQRVKNNSAISGNPAANHHRREPSQRSGESLVAFASAAVSIPVGPGRNRPRHAFLPFHGMETDDQTPRDVKQLHVAEPLCLGNRSDRLDGLGFDEQAIAAPMASWAVREALVNEALPDSLPGRRRRPRQPRGPRHRGGLLFRPPGHPSSVLSNASFIGRQVRKLCLRRPLAGRRAGSYNGRCTPGGSLLSLGAGSCTVVPRGLVEKTPIPSRADAVRPPGQTRPTCSTIGVSAIRTRRP